jgi:hypothetical protein
MKPYAIFVAILLFALTCSFILLPRKTEVSFNEIEESTGFSRITEYIIGEGSDNICSNREVHLAATRELGEYNYENSITKPYYIFKDRKTILASIQIYGKESYRVINLSSGFKISPLVTILDGDGKIIFNNEKDRNQRIFDFYSESTGDYIIEYKFEKEDYSKPANKCVSFAIGYK